MTGRGGREGGKQKNVTQMGGRPQWTLLNLRVAAINFRHEHTYINRYLVYEIYVNQSYIYCKGNKIYTQNVFFTIFSKISTIQIIHKNKILIDFLLNYF